MNARTESRTGSTHARDVMTENVISIGPDTPASQIAALLLDNHISAVPVIDARGIPVGIVSEGDLIGRDEQDRLSRTDWWLALMTGRLPLDNAFQERLRGAGLAARDVMSAPLVTVTEDTDIGEIARLFAIHHIKRVPVVRDGRLVGIVSRANLLRAVADGLAAAAAPAQEKPHGFLASLFGDYHLPVWQTVAGIQAAAPAPAAPAPPAEPPLAAESFKRLVEDYHRGESDHREAIRRDAARDRRERTKQLIDAHVFNDAWRQLLHRARVAAENGEREILLVRFPSQLCIDGGRAINTHEKGWPTTLRGRPAEIYLRWERDLRPRGFALSARVMDYPDGKPGDIGLLLDWGDDAAA